MSPALNRTLANSCRTAAGSETDLVLELLQCGGRWAEESMRSLVTTLTKDLHQAGRGTVTDTSFIANPGRERFSNGRHEDVIGLRELVREVAGMSRR